MPDLTPRMADVLDRIARARQPPLETLPPLEARATYARGAQVLEVPAPALTRVEDFSIPTRDGKRIAARLVAPSLEGSSLIPSLSSSAASLGWPVLVFFHGGGFTVGSIATHDTLCRVLSQRGGCAVVSVDYRLAPEHRFPTAWNDAWDAVSHIAAHGRVLGLDATRIALGGDSAGGTLAAACAIQARDAGLPIALQLLIYPGTSDFQDSGSHRRFAGGPLLTQSLIQYFFSQVLRSEADRLDWRFAPLLADDLEGVAPAWIGLAECDPMCDEGVAYADRLRAAAVPVELEIYRGVVHEFIKMGRAIPEAVQAQADAGAALKRALFT